VHAQQEVNLWAVVSKDVENAIQLLNEEVLLSGLSLCMGVCLELLTDPVSIMLYSWITNLRALSEAEVQQVVLTCKGIATGHGVQNVNDEVCQCLCEALNTLRTESASTGRNPRMLRSSFMEVMQCAWNVCNGKVASDTLRRLISAVAAGDLV
jgi:hypothetical protein